jgi:hypothetical protein
MFAFCLIMGRERLECLSNQPEGTVASEVMITTYMFQNGIPFKEHALMGLLYEDGVCHCSEPI